MGSSIYNNRQITMIDSDRIILGGNMTNVTNAHIIKGNVWVQSSFACFRLVCGDVIGISETLFSNYKLTYLAEEEVTITPYVFENASFRNLFRREPESLSVFYKSYFSQISTLLRIYDIYSKTASSMYSKLAIGEVKFKNISKQYSDNITDLGNFDGIKEKITLSYLDSSNDEYIRDMLKLDVNSLCELFKASPELASDFLLNSKLKSDFLISKILSFKSCLDEILNLYCGNGEKNLFTNYIKICRAIIDTKGNSDTVMMEIDKIIDEASNINNLFTEELNLSSRLPVERMTDLRDSLFNPLNNEEDQKALYNYSKEQIDNCMNEVSNLTEKLLDFAEYDSKAKEDFINSLNAYRLHQKVRFNKDVSRGFIKKFEEDFLILYEKVYLQTKIKKQLPITVILFLEYGLLSENYIEQEELLKLYHFAINNSFDSKYSIYTFRTWLDSIYNGINEPSKNELDEDYAGFVRSVKKNKSLTPEQEKEMLEDVNAKINYEINNFFKSNLRILFSSNATYCPFINEFDYSTNITGMLNTVNEIEKSMDKWLAIDYLLFYRDEIVTINHKGAYEKFNIQRQVLPNIIILPIFGQKGCMWQEIAAHSRKEPARFTLPMYKVHNDDDMLLYLFGKYKWEYTRTDLGVRWNDITVKSLTSEYNDYLMFYRKNKELNDISKNKIKDKLVACRNNLSEVFINDYVQYIRFESNSSPRLNKVAREILAMYCPFKKELRNKLSVNPMFEHYMMRIDTKFAAKQKELTNRIIKFEKEGSEIPESVKDYVKVLDM